MTNEEFQKMIANQLTELGNGQRELQKAIVRIENEQGEKISALYDSREVQLDVNERIIEALSRIENKLDKVSLKVAAHDSAIKRAK